MNGRILVNLIRFVAVLCMCGISWTAALHGDAHADTAIHDPAGSWTGEFDDNFWGLNMAFCADGIVVHATQQYQNPDGSRTIVAANYPETFLSHDTRAFSLNLTSIADNGSAVAVTPSLTTSLPTYTYLGPGLQTVPAHYPIAGASSESSTSSPQSGTVVFQSLTALSGTLTARIERWDHGTAGLALNGADDNFDYGDSDDGTDTDANNDIIAGGDPNDPNEGTSSDQDTVDTEHGDDPGDGSTGDDTQIFSSAVDSCSVLPATTASVSPSANSHGWNSGSVSVNLNSTDGALTTVDSGQGVAHITYAAHNANNSTTLSGTLSGSSGSIPLPSDGTWTVTYYATDTLGNNEASHTLTIKVDSVPPALNITGPANGDLSLCSGAPSPSFLPNDPALADGSAGSGIATSTDSVVHGTLQPSGVGDYTYTASATDNAGNLATDTRTYRVTYPFTGVLAPIASGASGGSFHLHQTVPVEFQLLCNGTPVTNAVAHLYLTQGASAHVPATASGGSADGNLFRYDSSGQQYIFNLSTKSLSAGNVILSIELDDGTIHKVPITLGG